MWRKSETCGLKQMNLSSILEEIAFCYCISLQKGEHAITWMIVLRSFVVTLKIFVAKKGYDSFITMGPKCRQRTVWCLEPTSLVFMYQDIKDVTSNNVFQMLHLTMFLNDIETVKCKLQATMLINAQKICANLKRGS